MVPFERAMVVSYRLSTVTVALSLTIRPQFVIECLRRSNQQRVGHFGAKFGKEGVDRCKPNFNAIWELHGGDTGRRNRVDSFFRLNTMQKRLRQTEHGTVTSIVIGKIAYEQPYQVHYCPNDEKLTRVDIVRSSVRPSRCVDNG